VLLPADILQGAVAPAHPNLFVIGAYDSRITFYSQQVRALELVYALREQGRLAPNMRCAVVGGGAAGLTAAAALVLISEVEVTLYEVGNEILPLQQASTRRHLDPHIYDWPAANTSDPVAGLPILDWTSGAARDVRRDVKLEFDGLAAIVGTRLQVKVRHKVTQAEPAGRALRLTFEHDPMHGDTVNADRRAESKDTFNLVLLAFGFGLEPPITAAGVAMPSYWSDAGVPGPEFEGRQRPRFMVSGNGDGALIDLVAAASANFDHGGMISEIVHQAGIERTFAELQTIDSEAQGAARAGNGFDFLAAYDARVMPALQPLGLLARVRQRLRPGVHIVLQTRGPEVFAIETATLNRLAAYLVIRACESDARAGFKHVRCPGLTGIQSPVPAPYDAPHWFDCGGELVGVDTVIVRHGPGRASVRGPFANVLSEFADAHKAWLLRHGGAIVVPRLSPAARSAFEEAALARGIPPARWLQQEMAAHVPLRVGVQARPEGVVWSGDVEPDAAQTIWATTARTTEFFCPPFPNELGPAAAAVLRLALHAPRAILVGDVGAWQAYARERTVDSAHAQHLNLPMMQAGVPTGVNHNPRLMAAGGLATLVHRTLDRWLLTEIDSRLSAYLATSHDPGAFITLRAAADVRTRMTTVWADWRARFVQKPELLSRFLRLMICARDDQLAVDEARVLLGPRKLPTIVRAVAVALAVAAGWTAMTPAGAPPGNLARTRLAGGPWAGHACGADLIDREPTALGAGRYMWHTHFVVLPMIDVPIEIAVRSAAGLAEVTGMQPSLRDSQDSPNIILTMNQAFRAAAESGLPHLADYLAGTEVAHFTRLRGAIEGPS
jgi:NAD(P)-binding Rossmann-like domain